VQTTCHTPKHPSVCTHSALTVQLTFIHYLNVIGYSAVLTLYLLQPNSTSVFTREISKRGQVLFVSIQGFQGIQVNYGLSSMFQ